MSTVAAPCPLTAAEKAVLELLAAGFTHAQIGEARGRTAGTIHAQIHTACKRLGVRAGADAVALCAEHGWIREPVPTIRRQRGDRTQSYSRRRTLLERRHHRAIEMIATYRYDETTRWQILAMVIFGETAIPA